MCPGALYTLRGMKIHTPPRGDEDPTGEQESVEFDGTQTDQLDDTYRFRVVAASENAKPITRNLESTSDLWKALENSALVIEELPPPEPEPEPEPSYNPYDTSKPHRK